MVAHCCAVAHVRIRQLWDDNTTLATDLVACQPLLQAPRVGHCTMIRQRLGAWSPPRSQCEPMGRTARPPPLSPPMAPQRARPRRGGAAATPATAAAASLSLAAAPAEPWPLGGPTPRVPPPR